LGSWALTLPQFRLVNLTGSRTAYGSLCLDESSREQSDLRTRWISYCNLGRYRDMAFLRYESLNVFSNWSQERISSRTVRIRRVFLQCAPTNAFWA
jgi:hypothetical protein